VEAYGLYKKVKSEDLRKRIGEIIPIVSIVKPTDLVIYELSEKMVQLTFWEIIKGFHLTRTN